jgi:hypothetical protein
MGHLETAIFTRTRYWGVFPVAGKRNWLSHAAYLSSNAAAASPNRAWLAAPPT